MFKGPSFDEVYQRFYLLLFEQKGLFYKYHNIYNPCKPANSYVDANKNITKLLALLQHACVLMFSFENICCFEIRAAFLTYS